MTSRCINCKRKRRCYKIEAKAPYKYYQWDERLQCNVLHHYEEHGAMIEICVDCLKADHGALAAYLLSASKELVT